MSSWYDIHFFLSDLSSPSQHVTVVLLGSIAVSCSILLLSLLAAWYVVLSINNNSYLFSVLSNGKQWGHSMFLGNKEEDSCKGSQSRFFPCESTPYPVCIVDICTSKLNAVAATSYSLCWKGMPNLYLSSDSSLSLPSLFLVCFHPHVINIKKLAKFIW